jgi:hypothetical protein
MSTRHRLFLLVFLVQLPLMVLMSLVAVYVATYESLQSSYQYGFHDAVVFEVKDEWQASGEASKADGVREDLRALVSSERDLIIVLGLGDSDFAGVGIFDPADFFAGIAFNESDYVSVERLVSLDQRSLLTRVDPEVVVRLTQAGRLLPGYDNRWFVDVEYAFNLFSTKSFAGEWVVVGQRSKAITDEVIVLLRGAGYQVSLVDVEPFPTHQQYFWAALLTAVLSAVAACVAWLTQVPSLRRRLRIEVLLGARPLQTVLRYSYWVLLPWLVGVVVGFGGVVAVVKLMGAGFFGGVRFSQSSLLLLAGLLFGDLLLVFGAFILRALPLARIRL